MTTVCKVPPPGWTCSRKPGHEGPCAARPEESDSDPIVGSMRMTDGARVPIRQAYANEIWAQIEADRERRQTLMPDLATCLKMLGDVSQRLRELGWRDAIYCPKDGSTFEVIEFGSTGIHQCHYEGKWPTGSWWVHDAGDEWPSRPVLFRELERKP